MSIAKSAVLILFFSLLFPSCQDKREFDLSRGPFLTLEEVTDQRVRISWGDDYAAARELRVERKRLGRNFKVLAKLAPAEREYTDDTVEENREYKYRLRALFPGGRTDRSVILEVTVPPAPVPLVVSPTRNGKVSPDGRFLARRHGGRVLVLDLDSGALAPASAGDLGPESGFCWMPDSRHLVLAAGPPGLEDLFLVDSWSGECRRVTATGEGASEPEVSPDGRLLVFRRGDGLYRIPLDVRPKPEGEGR